MASVVTFIDVIDHMPIARWAHENCPSFTGLIIVDMAPESLSTDYRFYFEDERDMINFILRWQGQNAGVQ